MSNEEDIQYIIVKKLVYVIKVGPIYFWDTAATNKAECLRKGLQFFKVESEHLLKIKGAELIRLFTKEIIAQDNKSNKSV
jgi:hypothetical protein